MNEQQQTSTERPPTERAEEMLNRLGQRFTDMRSTVGKAFEQRAQQRQGGASGGPAGPTRPATERAEETLGGWGERVGYFAGVAGLRLRQWGARAREEAEDLWAEAQSVRQQQGASGGTSSATGNGAATSGSAEGYKASASTEMPHGQDEGPEPEQRDESAQPS